MLKRPNNDLIPKAKYWPQLQNCCKLKFLLQKGCEKWQMFGLLLNFYYLYLSLSYCQLIFFYYEFVQFYSQLDLCFEYLRLDTTLFGAFKTPEFLKAGNQSIQDSNSLYFIHCTYGQRTASYIMFYKFHTYNL